ncbi:hypothetical protein [Isachenkonia alkalipeptolytica]|uniref:DUF8042 domain-containing protein n=1 Tax=Isachenkonia alkalipeptolytica TaxID=2565777 RepID=A0AA43XK08_9CLOT|nr:hypothetical protein [Isachenkonia alkalipeptolytica]NBG88283.1 hypothetical protein [Isachenkonia alkalipeptolytica]
MNEEVRRYIENLLKNMEQAFYSIGEKLLYLEKEDTLEPLLDVVMPYKNVMLALEPEMESLDTKRKTILQRTTEKLENKVQRLITEQGQFTKQKLFNFFNLELEPAFARWKEAVEKVLETP